MRRSHTKSRYGCKERKQRKVKCDEARPACSRCVAATRQCSLSSLLAPTSSPSATPHVPTSGSLTPSGSIKMASVGSGHARPYLSSPVSTLTSGQAEETLFQERYSLCHLELLFYLKDRLAAGLLPLQPQLNGFVDLMVRESFKTPYLMNEMLAFAAAHRSTVAHEGQSYRLESTRLQSRALEQFNSGQIEVTDENCVAVFAFSTLLGQHTLFDTFSGTNELPTALDKLIHCINLYQGIRAVAGQSWQKVSCLIQTQVSVDPVHMSAETPAASGSECDSLLQKLRHANMAPQTLQHYEEAVQILQYLFDTSEASNGRWLVAWQEWLVRLSKEFVSLLVQRRPEALVVVAFYGVLLHRARDYWVIGDAGRFLIQGISNQLGRFWSDWLAWPNELF